MPQSRIRLLERVGRSINGNPQYRVHFVNGAIYLTTPDSMVTADIESAQYQDNIIEYALDNRGEIYDINVVSDQ